MRDFGALRPFPIFVFYPFFFALIVRMFRIFRFFGCVFAVFSCVLQHARG